MKTLRNVLGFLCGFLLSIALGLMFGFGAAMRNTHAQSDHITVETPPSWVQTRTLELRTPPPSWYDIGTSPQPAPSFLIVQQSSLEILRISALPHLPEPETPTEHSFVRHLTPRYIRPKTPEEVIITLFTEDGKQWKAKWEEVK